MDVLLWIAVVVVALAWIAGVFYAIFDLVAREDVSGTVKLAWVLLIVLLPLVGIIGYVLLGRSSRHAPRGD